MKPAYSLDLTPEARADLRTILRTSRQAWGQEQRDRYAQQLLDAMNALTVFPNLGRSREDLEPGLHGHTVGQHIIYYVIDEQSIRVARILHSRMDTAGQFDP